MRRDEIRHIAGVVHRLEVFLKIGETVAAAGVRVEVDVAGEKAVEVVEAMRVRSELGLEAKVPLADEARRVARVFHELWKRASGRYEAFLEWRTDGREGALEADALLVSPGDQRGARRRALRRRVEVGETDPFTREAIDVGCLHIARAIGAEVAVADVVGDDGDAVRPTGRRLGTQGKRSEDKKSEATHRRGARVQGREFRGETSGARG